MSDYPRWLQLLVAFCAPAFSALAGIAASGSERDWLAMLIAFCAAGFGGLAGLGINDFSKRQLGGTTDE
jgi:4-hydroxybenzoate polyprenyltransferase